MKSIVFFNNKGGVGKTTLLCNVAAYLSLHKRLRILVIDADPQCNTTSYTLPETELESLYSKVKRETIESFLHPVKRGKGYLQEGVTPIKSPRFGFDLVPGDPRLALSEDTLAADWNPAIAGDARGLQTTYVFGEMAQKYSDYDFVIFDVGPSLGAINRAILISSDYFLVPMSVDVFSLMALNNINLSLEKWKSGLMRGLEDYQKEEGSTYKIGNQSQSWHLNFIGYVMQQYKAKTIKGERIHVNAYEKISRQVPEKISSEIMLPFGKKDIEPFLGEVQNLHSLVPLSQSAKAPIFELKSRDGVVGSHFSKVTEAKQLFREIAEHMLVNIESPA